jgi:hypothetical protein
MKKIFKKRCMKIMPQQVEPNAFERNNLKAIEVWEIKGEKYVIKPVNRYFFKFGVLVKDGNKDYRMLYNSDNIDFLRNCLFAKHCVTLSKVTDIDEAFITGNYDKNDWYPERNDKRYLNKIKEERKKRQLAC